MNDALGEFELIAAIRDRIARAGGSAESPGLIVGSGDDAAISDRPGVSVTSVDSLIEGVHFRMPPFEPRSVGHKALAAALSDIAAMGAAPREAYVQLGIGDRIDDPQLLELADGFAALAARHRIAIAGGDVTRAPALLVAVTVVGEARDAGSLVLRSGAAPGDALAVTGELGGAAAGLLLLDRPELVTAVDGPVAAALRRRQLEPEPRIAAGAALAEAGATAMIDLSDGLGGDAAHVAAASGVAMRIDGERLPVQDGVAAVAEAAEAEALDLAAGGGEDYELLVAMPEDRLAEASAAVASAGTRLTVIGSVGAGAGVQLTGPGGAVRPSGGFDQLRQRRGPSDRA